MHIVARNTTDVRGYPLHGNHHLSPLYGSDFQKGHRRTNSGDSRHSHIGKFKFGSGLLIPSDNNETSDEESDFDDTANVTQEFVTNDELTDDHDCEKEECRRVVINVSGMKFETQLRTLNRLPNTLLGDPKKRDKFWDSQRQEYFFDRYRPCFPAILYFYQSGGRLERPIEVASDIFMEELQFFELGKYVLNAFRRKEGFLMDAEPPVLPKSNLQRKVWEVFEYPDSSFLAKIVAFMSVTFILVSVVTFCVETLPVFKGSNCIHLTAVSEHNETIVIGTYPNFRHPLFIIESICITWFVFELIVRFSFSPSKLLFVKDAINWIDFAAIMPYFVFLIMFFITQECSESQKSGAISVLRVLRVTRILKLSKHSEGLKIFGKTMQSSISELTMFALFLGIGVVIFSGAIYYAELPNSKTHFVSIPDAFWWAVVSMTTVGYGDVYPQSIIGKVIGSMTVLCGLLAIALPVPVIVTNFNNFYRSSSGQRGKGL